MSSYSLSHVSDLILLRDLKSLVARDRATTAELLAHIAEVDDRRLYAPAGYPSMYSYCVHELRLSEEAAFKRIHAARAARRFPAIFAAVADGRLHLSAVVLLAPYLTRENAGELLGAAANRSKAEIEQILAERFPRPDLPTRLEAVGVASTPTRCTESFALPPGTPSQNRDEQHAPGRVAEFRAVGPEDQHDPGRAEAPAPRTAEESPTLPPGQLSPEPVDTAGPRPKLTPLAPQRYALQVTLGQSAHDLLRQAQALLAHQLPSGNVAEILERALAALVEKPEKRKFAATDRPRRGHGQSRSLRPSPNPRRIPAHVKRAVWDRDAGQCSFVSDSGQRCPARSLLETIWNDGLAVVRSCRLREERPTAVARSHPRSRVSASGARAAYERSPS